MANRRYKSELAGKFQKRFKKNVDKLFTFLDYDGVPWNNNYAEHAIKVFAHYRKLVNGTVSDAGIKDYLVLLSIYQTCRYKGLSFLNFLLSEETDIDSFDNVKLKKKSPLIHQPPLPSHSI